MTTRALASILTPPFLVQILYRNDNWVGVCNLDGSNPQVLKCEDIKFAWKESERQPEWECNCVLPEQHCQRCDAAAAEGYDIDRTPPEHYKITEFTNE